MGNPWAYDFSAIGNRTQPLVIILGGDGEAAAKGSGFRFAGNSDVYQLIPRDLPFEQINLGKQFYKQQGRADLSRFHCVLNLVTDPDVHPRTLERLRKLLRGYRGRVVNRPEAVLRSTRDQVARRLSGIEGLRVPKVLRLRHPKPGAAAQAAERAGLTFPAIAREAGTHTGKIIGLVDGPAQLEAACSAPGEYYVTEFVDFGSADGIYRKYRLWSFAGRAILKHVIMSDTWNVHNADRTRVMIHRPDLMDEERRLLARPEGDLPGTIHRMFDQVQARMGLEFFGMDFGIDEAGQAILFEANPTMSFLMQSPHAEFGYLDRVNPPSQEAFRDMLFPPG